MQLGCGYYVFYALWHDFRQINALSSPLHIYGRQNKANKTVKYLDEIGIRAMAYVQFVYKRCAVIIRITRSISGYFFKAYITNITDVLRNISFRCPVSVNTYLAT